ncbi:MAG: MBL fold metallo-hydrolase [Halobacteriales archaeon]
MVDSDWGDWLPTAITEADPDGVAMWYLGCNGFILKADDGTTCFIDPYLGTGDPPRTIRMIPVPFDPVDVEAADAVLATHEHTDHVHGPSQAPILAGSDATFIGPASSVAVATEEAWAERWDLTTDQYHTVAVDDTIEIGSLTVHVQSSHDPDAIEPVSYVIEHDAGTIFHGGDTKPDTDLAVIGERFDIDIGIVAFGSAGRIPDKETHEPKDTVWYCDENELVEVTRAVEADQLLPTHWDMWKGLTADPTALHEHIRGFEYPKRLEIVEIGDRINL